MVAMHQQGDKKLVPLVFSREKQLFLSELYIA